MSQPIVDPQSGPIVDPTQSGGVDPSNPNPVDPGQGQGQPTDPQSGQPTGKTYTQAEMDAIMARMQAADRNRTEAQDKLKKIEQAQMTELDRTKAQLTEAQNALVQAQQANQERALENAFLADNTYSWHNSEDALALLDRAGVEVKEDGTVSGMKAAIEKLSKERAYLIKPAEGTNNNGLKSGPTGVPGTAKPQAGTNDHGTMEKRFSALRGRVPRIY